MTRRIKKIMAIRACMLATLFMAFLTFDALAIHYVDDSHKTTSTFSQVEESTLVLSNLGNESGHFNFSSTHSFHKSKGLDTLQYWLPQRR